MQAECRRFESDYLHQPPLKLWLVGYNGSLKHLLAEEAGSIFEKWELEIKENYNSYTRSGRGRPWPKREEFLRARIQKWNSAKRIRAHDGCLGIRRRRRTRKTATILGEPSTGFDPGVSEWGNPAAFIGGKRRVNT